MGKNRGSYRILRYLKTGKILKEQWVKVKNRFEKLEVEKNRPGKCKPEMMPPHPGNRKKRKNSNMSNKMNKSQMASNSLNMSWLFYCLWSSMCLLAANNLNSVCNGVKIVREFLSFCGEVIASGKQEKLNKTRAPKNVGSGGISLRKSASKKTCSGKNRVQQKRKNCPREKTVRNTISASVSCGNFYDAQ